MTDLYQGGDLKNELMNKGLYSEERAASLIKQMLECISYFHGEGVVHRDIKPGSESYGFDLITCSFSSVC